MLVVFFVINFDLAPEVINDETYGLSVDMWSIGSIIYFMLFRKPPYFGLSDDEIAELQEDGVLDFPSSTHVSEEGNFFCWLIIDTVQWKNWLRIYYKKIQWNGWQQRKHWNIDGLRCQHFLIPEN